MLFRRSSLFVAGVVALGLAMSGCAAPAPTAAGGEAFNDPLEDTNRAIFGVFTGLSVSILMLVLVRSGAGGFIRIGKQVYFNPQGPASAGDLLLGKNLPDPLDNYQPR